MRLTLRTLLAYLDNTLDPQDAEALRDKLGESGFATQLVQRIRNTLENGSLPAPSPEAVAPVEDANVISEYLDSTLPTEQVAEIERACLESDPHLAEAAACHQILTMILGKPAAVSPELRQRIYELPDRKIEDIAVAGSFSAVAIPVDNDPLNPLSPDLPTSELTSPRDGAPPVQPVGVTDSGVSDAPTRLREAEDAAPHSRHAARAIAGSQSQSDQPPPVFTGSMRPSRVAPWLVILGLAAALLFVMAQAFRPLLNPPIASVNSNMDGAVGNEIDVPPDQAPVMTEIETPTDVDDTASDPASDGAESLPSPITETSPSEGADSSPPSSPDGDTTDSVAGSPEASPTEPAPADQGEMAATDDTPPPANDVAADENAPKLPPDADPTQDMATPGGAETEDKASVAGAGPPLAVPPPVDPPPADKVADPKLEPIAKVTGPETLLSGLVGDQWVRLKKDDEISEGVKVSCAPTFRAQLETDDVLVTVVGPAQVEWVRDVNDAVALKVDFGRILASTKKANTSFGVLLGEEPVQFKFADAQTVAAASIKRFRAPGFDPLLPENRIPLAGILSVQGDLTVLNAGQDATLQTGQQWVKRGDAEAKVSPVESVPTWIDPPDPKAASLEASARDGLIELLKADQPLEIGLREASLFRRTEVSALAGQTLLNLGRPDVYFGGDGILSEPKQRAYWPDHYISLLATVDRSVESAQQVHASINSMDSANAEPLFRLLTGYSQKQLVEGGDEELVELLDSSSMAVRVLALENLHRITGTTLYFRAEQENAVRRASVIKKWVTRQRKGDIRWQE